MARARSRENRLSDTSDASPPEAADRDKRAFTRYCRPQYLANVRDCPTNQPQDIKFRKGPLPNLRTLLNGPRTFFVKLFKKFSWHLAPDLAHVQCEPLSGVSVYVVYLVYYYV